MLKLYFTIFILIFYANIANSQSPKLHCVETSKRNGNNEKNRILIKTCYFKKIKFVTISNPDEVGRYFPENEEHQVYVLIHGKYIKTKYSNLFNKKENELLVIINKKIHEQYQKNSTSSESKGCFNEIDPIPDWYKMDDLEISFEGNKIWFSVSFGLSTVCRFVDGSIVELKFDDIVKYLK